LRQVISADSENEVAWMWLASAVESLSERRACLERALEINPSNRRAQEALKRLETVESAGRAEEGRRQADDQRRIRRDTLSPGGGGVNLYFVLAAVVLVLIVGAVIFSVVNTVGTPAPVTQIAEGVNLGATTPTPTIDPATYTETPVLGVVVTFDREDVTLPPTFTPTFTPEPSETLPPSATPFPLDSFVVLYSGFAPDGAQSLLGSIRADGSGDNEFGADTFSDAAIDPSGQRITFVREGGIAAFVDAPPPTPEDGEAGEESEEEAPPEESFSVFAPQLYVAPLADLGAAAQLTEFTGTRLANPTWSPDGSQIAFTSNHVGNDDVWTVNVDGSGEPRRLTGNEGTDRDPAWSPDGRSIAFASDLENPAFQQYASETEIYVMDADGNNPRRFTDANGASYTPTWSPDGRWIVFVSDRSGDADLYIMDGGMGEGENLLTFDDNGAEDRNPVFTPDGRWVAFASNRESPNFQVYIVDLRGDEVRRLTFDERDLLSIDLYPN
jgi:hypothetical protein